LPGTENKLFQPVPYRIRIGVTGHRSLADEAAIRVLVKKVLETEIDGLFDPESRLLIERGRRENAPPVLYSVLTPLAEGADRLVANVVREFPQSRLDAVLPLVEEDYLEDFATEESRREFRELLGLCRRPVRLRKTRIQADARNESHAGELRRAAYESAGHYVVSHCDVLIAIWDGREARGRGGTANIVKYAEEQRRPFIRIWKDETEIVSVNRGDGLNASALADVAAFNNADVSPADRRGYVDNLEKDYFRPFEDGSQPVSEESKDLVRTCLFPYYVQASRQAKKYQSRFLNAGIAVYIFSALAVGCVAAALLFPALSVIAYAAEFILLLIILWTVFRAHHSRANERWMENRFLTERIRSGIYVAIAGVDVPPVEVLPFMGHSHTVDDWTVRVFDEIWHRMPRFPDCGDNCAVLARYIRERWIEGQIRYHIGKQKRSRRWGSILSWSGRVLFLMTMAAAGFKLWMKSSPGLVPDEHWMNPALAMVAILAPATAASMVGLRAQREYLRNEKRSKNILPQLQYLNNRLAASTEPAMFESVILQVDEVMLRETQEWLMLMRYIDLEAA